MNRTEYRTARALIRGNGFAYAYRVLRESDDMDPLALHALHALEQLSAERDPLQVRANAVRYGANHRERVVLYCPPTVYSRSRIGMRALGTPVA
ncbi:MAG TPA: hypothetical protein VFS02_22300 [Telluria sp.]|nr:hypothetical protein [Telluria sp.]